MIFSIVALLALQAAPAQPIVRTLPAVTATQDPLAGLSSAGRAIVEAEMPIENQRQRGRQARYAAAMAALKRTLSQRPLNLPAVQRALADRDRILDENRRAQSAAAIRLMGRLSEEDRRIVGQAIVRSPGSI
jgi:hypothetical protein